MIHKDDNDFDDFLRKKMEDLPSGFNASQWSQMEKMLGQSGHTRSALLWQSIKSKLFVAAGVMTGSGALFFFGLNLNNPDQDKYVVAVEKHQTEQLVATKPLAEKLRLSEEKQIVQVPATINRPGKSENRSLASLASGLSAQNPLAGLSEQIIRKREDAWLEDAAGAISAANGSATEGNFAARLVDQTSASEPNSTQEIAADGLNGSASNEYPVSKHADLSNPLIITELAILNKLDFMPLSPSSEANPSPAMAAQQSSTGITSTAYEASQGIDPVVGAGKLMKQTLGIAAGFQSSKPYNNTSCNLAPGGFVELTHVLQLGRSLSIQSELGLNYREGLNYSKSSSVYIPGFGLEKYSYTVNNKGSMNVDLLSGVALHLGKAGIVNISTGPQIMLDTRSRIDKELDTLLIPEGNWGYRAGYRKFDWMLRAGYQLPLCNHLEWIINAGFGLRSDNTDDTYFGVLRNDRNLYLRSGLRYMIQGRKAQSLPERFSEK